MEIGRSSVAGEPTLSRSLATSVTVAVNKGEGVATVKFFRDSAVGAASIGHVSSSQDSSMASATYSDDDRCSGLSFAHVHKQAIKLPATQSGRSNASSFGNRECNRNIPGIISAKCSAMEKVESPLEFLLVQTIVSAALAIASSSVSPPRFSIFFDYRRIFMRQ